jgi:Glyoxalase-like domain
MAVRFQLVMDCRDPEPLARFWAAALGYVFAPPPEGFSTWDDYWREIGVPEQELGLGQDRIVDPAGSGPAIWFQVVPDGTAQNQPPMHIDIRASGGRADPIEIRKQRVDAEARRLADLGATISGPLANEGLDHYAVGMRDPEGNAFDIN